MAKTGPAHYIKDAPVDWHAAVCSQSASKGSANPVDVAFVQSCGDSYKTNVIKCPCSCMHLLEKHGLAFVRAAQHGLLCVGLLTTNHVDHPNLTIVHQSLFSFALHPSIPLPSNRVEKHRNAPRNTGLAVNWSTQTFRAARPTTCSFGAVAGSEPCHLSITFIQWWITSG